MTRRYSFTAVHEGNQGHTWDCFVTIRGQIDSLTGMVTDIGALDRLTQGEIGKVFEGQDLRQVFGTQEVTGEFLTKAVWDRLVKSIPGGTLEKIRLVQTRDLMFEYSG